jgi:DNA replicative helicase MCM subunit Mcm2 (Cdc46/Mcm family)
VIDSSATQCAPDRTRWVVTLATRDLVDDVAFVARSLGLCVSTQRARNVVAIGGTAVELIAVRDSKRLRAPVDESMFDIAIDLLPADEYYGFALDGNARFVVGTQFVVTHNSQLLRAVNTVAARGVYVCGSYSSASGA